MWQSSLCNPFCQNPLVDMAMDSYPIQWIRVEARRPLWRISVGFLVQADRSSAAGNWHKNSGVAVKAVCQGHGDFGFSLIGSYGCNGHSNGEVECLEQADWVLLGLSCWGGKQREGLRAWLSQTWLVLGKRRRHDLGMTFTRTCSLDL